MKPTINNPLLLALILITLNPILTATASGDLAAEAGIAIRNLQSADPTLTNLFNNSAGYAVFPRVGKAGLILGAEYGTGIVYENGKAIGEAGLTEINVGPEVGGEAFYEILLFEAAEALAGFKEDHFEMSAKVSAVAAAEGAALNATYQAGVVVFTMPRSGLMAQVAIGRQKFRFKPFNAIP